MVQNNLAAKSAQFRYTLHNYERSVG